MTIDPPFGSRSQPAPADGHPRDVDVTTGVFPGGMVVTIEGERQIDEIYPGDIVMVLGNIGYSPVQRVREVVVDLSLRPEATPILFRAGALEARSPIRDTMVAPQSLIGIDDQLIPATSLVNLRTIAPAPATGRVRYLQLEMLVHEMVIVDGIRVATQARGHAPCRPLIEAPEALDRIRARIAARVERPAPGGVALPEGLRPRLSRRF